MKHCFYSQVAREKLGAPEEWRWVRLEAVGRDDTLVEGGVPRTLKSGPNKGKATWRDVRLERAVVTRAELVKAQTAFERETGKCHRCQGEGKQVAAAHSDGSVDLIDCARCNGTGSAP